MSKIRIPNKFGQVPNDLLNDNKITLKAKGLYGFMQSKPDNWDFTISKLQSQLKEGEDAIRQAIKELEIAGWLTRYNYKNEKGQWDCDYELHIKKVENNQPLTNKPYADFPYAEKPFTEKTVTVKPPYIKKKDITKKDNKKRLDNKNKQKEKKFILADSPEFHLLDEEVQNLLIEFWKTKKGAKTEQAFLIILKTLKQMTKNLQIEAIEKAIVCEYKTIYLIEAKIERKGFIDFNKTKSERAIEATKQDLTNYKIYEDFMPF